MYRLSPALQHYEWGSTTAIPQFLGTAGDGRPVAEAWFGAHPSGPARLTDDSATLRDLIASAPTELLGADVSHRFGVELPFLLKLIAPARPLSLQVHPSAEQAALGWVREQRAGIDPAAPHRTYRDANHKPEMVYALTEFEALSGFRTARRALSVLEGIDVPLVTKAVERIRHNASAPGMRSAFEYLLLGARDRDHDVDTAVEALRDRLARGVSPSEHSDQVALRLAEHFPGDRGVLASLLLNPVTLQPGEVMFVPAGCVHAYVSGLAIEVMASSDNVVRAGLTPKHVDARALLDIVDVQPAPPMRVAAENVSEEVAMFYAPVEDFELAVIDLVDASAPDAGADTSATSAAPGAGGSHSAVPLGRPGPRILLVIDGELTVTLPGRSDVLRRGEAVFLAGQEVGHLSGTGRAVRVSVP